MRIDPKFNQRLWGFDRSALDAREDTIFAIDSSYRLTYVNDAWDRFAREGSAHWAEGAWDLGASVLEATSPRLRPFYEELYGQALLGTPIDHEYDCHTPHRLRVMRMRVYALKPDGWLVVNSLVVTESAPEGSPPDRSAYVAASGEISMCSHCRRTHRVGGERWDWVPEWVAHVPEDASQDLCRICFEYHYGRRNIR